MKKKVSPFTNMVKFIPKGRRGPEGMVKPASYYEVSSADISLIDRSGGSSGNIAPSSSGFVNPTGGGTANDDGGGGGIQIEDLVPSITNVSPTVDTTLLLNEVTTDTQELTVSADTNIADPALLAYQWEQSTDGGSTWTAITGETGTTYTIPAGLDFATNDNEKYRCEITHPDVVNSPQYTGVTTLDIKRTITISAQPTLVGGSANNGSTTTFTVTASITSGTIDYQWQYKASGSNTWSDINTAISNSYTTDTLDININTDDQYRVVLSNAEANSVTSATVTLVISGADFRVQPSINDIEFWDLADNGPLIFDPSNSLSYTITSLNTARSKFSAKMWGQGSCSSEGGHSYGEVPVTAGDVFTVNLNAGRGVSSNGQHGGGYAGIFDGTVSQANALMIAGGAGSGGDDGTDTCGNDGGDGGGYSGGDGTDESVNLTGGDGGTQSAGGTGGAATGSASGTSFSQTYTSNTTVVIPSGVQTVTYTIHGGAGGSGGSSSLLIGSPPTFNNMSGGAGGKGQKITGTLTGVGGSTLDIITGNNAGSGSGTNGANTGGASGSSPAGYPYSGGFGGSTSGGETWGTDASGGGGGAASIISIGSSNILAIAGGGGGGGGAAANSSFPAGDGFTSSQIGTTIGSITSGYTGGSGQNANGGAGGGGGGSVGGYGGPNNHAGNHIGGAGGNGGDGYYNPNYHVSASTLQTSDSNSSYVTIEYQTLGSDGTDGAALQGGNGGAAGSGEGQDLFDTPGSTTWTCPLGVNSVSVVAVGAGGRGGGAGGGGGGLGYKNNISVTPGQSYTVVVGAPGQAGGSNGGDSYFISTSTVRGGGGTNGWNGGGGGSYTGDGGGNGGSGSAQTSWGGGGGGAGGYSGNGGNAGTLSGSAGSGGGGGGGAGHSNTDSNDSKRKGGGGGGVGVYGQGTNGAGAPSTTYGGDGGSGGSGGTDGADSSVHVGGPGGLYGGGSGGANESSSWSQGSYGGNPGKGAVRIIWGTGRSFPSTLTADQSTTSGSNGSGGAGGGGYFGGGGGSAGQSGTAGGGGGSGYIDSTLTNAVSSAFAASSDTDRGTAGSVDSDSRVVINDTFISITQQPAGAVVSEGSTHTFTVTASVNDLASPIINYQWQKKISGTWTDISGATSSSYTTPSITASDNNSLYRCSLTNEFSSNVISDQAVILTSATGTTTYSLTTTGLTSIPLTDATEFSFKIWGAGGGGTGEGCGGPYSGGAGGFGAKTVTVPSGDTSSLSVFVGATGAGDSGAGLSGYGAGRGGQRTYIEWVPTGSIGGYEWIVGGGGGAGQSGNGGGGGGLATGVGGNGSGPNAGTGANTSTGGGQGGSSNGGTAGGTGGGGNSGGGAAGGAPYNQGNRGGGGGSGYFGGGGGGGDNTGNNCTGGGAGGGSGGTFESSYSGVTISNSLSQNGSNGSGSGAAAPYNTDPDYVSGRGSNGNDGLAVVTVTIPGGLQMTGVNTNTITEIKDLSSTTTLTEPVYINAQDQDYDVRIKLRGNSPSNNGGWGSWVTGTVRMKVGEIFLLHYDSRYAAVFYGSSAIGNNCVMLAAEGGYEGNPRSESGAGGLPRPSEPLGGNAGYPSGSSGASLNGSGGGGGGTTSGYRSGTGGNGGAKGGDLSASAGSAGGFFSAGSGGGGVDGSGGAGGFGYYGGGGGGGGWDTGISYGAYFGGGGGGGSSYYGGLPSPSVDSNSPAQVTVSNTSFGNENGGVQIQIISVAPA